HEAGAIPRTPVASPERRNWAAAGVAVHAFPRAPEISACRVDGRNRRRIAKPTPPARRATGALIREPGPRFSELAGRKKLHRRPAEPGSRKSQRVRLPARLADDGDLRDLVAVRE